MNQLQVIIDPLSVTSLHVEVFTGGTRISSATGFTIERNGSQYLVTNWHVVTGINPDTNEILSKNTNIPDELRVWMHIDPLGTWQQVRIPLLDSSSRELFLVNSGGQSTDVVIVPLSNLSAQIKVYPFDLSLSEIDMIPEVAMPVSIIGFPQGMSAEGKFPIWKTGHLASEYDINYAGKPTFLVDATTRSGMSGSPVVMKMNGGYKNKNGNYIISGGVKTRFLGIYSGRIHKDIEVGKVWKPIVLEQIFASNNL
ncbi:MAG: trypsin-like peptidase domain-containing protein [Syntrophaceae bacterium]|nr:trypsin-like peptidase domain-containing protein [Syntrophaceae bacterium]